VKLCGYLLLVIGLALMVGAFFFPISVQTQAESVRAAALAAIRGMTDDQARPVLESAWALPTSVTNIDKVEMRAMFNLSGAAVMIVGAVFAAAGELKASGKAAKPAG
jgi:hypothetical protein